MLHCVPLIAFWFGLWIKSNRLINATSNRITTVLFFFPSITQTQTTLTSPDFNDVWVITVCVCGDGFSCDPACQRSCTEGDSSVCGADWSVRRVPCIASSTLWTLTHAVLIRAFAEQQTHVKTRTGALHTPNSRVWPYVKTVIALNGEEVVGKGG